MEASPMKEFVLWGLPEGKTDFLYAQVLFSGPSMQEVEKIKRLASKQGWHTFRIQTLDLSQPFDAGGAFANAVTVRKKAIKPKPAATGWVRRGWDMHGFDCMLVIKQIYDAAAPISDTVVEARIMYGNQSETVINLGRFMSISLTSLKARVSAEARQHGYFPRSKWSPWTEEPSSEGETW
jgi:hypothetical protein